VIRGGGNNERRGWYSQNVNERKEWEGRKSPRKEGKGRSRGRGGDKCAAKCCPLPFHSQTASYQ
jgi:hypothetical protein